MDQQLSLVQRFVQRVFTWAAVASAVPGLLLVLMGVGQFVEQLLYWMRNGEWFPLPAVLLFGPKQNLPILRLVPDLYWSTSFIDWLTWPNDWRGIAHIVSGVLYFFSSPVVCAALGMVVAALPALMVGTIGGDLVEWLQAKPAKQARS